MTRLSPIVFAQEAQAFLDAARREFEQPGVGMSFPGYFLASRSCELALKSFLLLKGHEEYQLKGIGHDLDRALGEARSFGLDEVIRLGPQCKAAIEMVNIYYETKDLEYPTTGYKSYPDAKYLLGCVAQLLDGLQPLLRTWRPTT